MYKAKITNIEKARHQATNSDFLDVAFEIVDADDNVVASKRLGFDVSITKDELLAELANHCEGYKATKEREARNAEREAIEKHVDDLKQLDGQTVDPVEVRKAKKPKGDVADEPAS